MSESPAFSFYAKDFMLGTMALSLAERGAYITLLSYQWDRGSVPAGRDALGRIFGCSSMLAQRLWDGISDKFSQGEDGLWRNERLEFERRKQMAFRQLQSIRGKRSALNRKVTKPQPSPNRASTKRPLQPEGNSPSPSPSPKEKDLMDPRGSSDENGSAVRKAENGEIRAFLATFCELYKKFRHGAKYVVNREKDVPLVRRLLGVHSRDRLERLAELLQRTEDEWIAETDRSIGILSNRISWLDSRLAEAEAHLKKAENTLPV